MKIPKLRWVIAFMLLAATAINYGDRLALSVVSPDLRREFGMSEWDYSQVVALFMLGLRHHVRRFRLRGGPAGHAARLRGFIVTLCPSRRCCMRR